MNNNFTEKQKTCIENLLFAFRNVTTNKFVNLDFGLLLSVKVVSNLTFYEILFNMKNELCLKKGRNCDFSNYELIGCSSEIFQFYERIKQGNIQLGIKEFIIQYKFISIESEIPLEVYIALFVYECSVCPYFLYLFADSYSF